MSSFRIDRQNVTFETAEMRLIYATGQSSDEKKSTAGVDEDLKEKERQHREILEKARKEAENNARLIVEGAKSDAELILSNTRKTASAILKEAQNKSADIMETAKLEGYKQGQKEAEISTAARKNEEAKELERLEDSLKANYSELLGGMRDDVTSLVIEMTKKIIGIKLKESDQVFMDLINGAIDQLKHAGNIIIHVCPEDYERYFGSDANENLMSNTNAKLAVIEEEKYSGGDLVVESEGEVFDLSIFKQIERIEKAFSNEEK